MKIEIVAVDRIRSAWAREALEEYLGRIARYCAVERRAVKRAGDDQDERVSLEMGIRGKRVSRPKLDGVGGKATCGEHEPQP